MENSIQESRNAEEKAKKAITDVSSVLPFQRWCLEIRKGLLSQSMTSRFHLLTAYSQLVNLEKRNEMESQERQRAMDSQ